MRLERTLIPWIAVLIGLALSGCKCPGLFNKNCAMTVSIAIDGDPAEINDGNALQVTVVMARDGDEVAKVQSNRAWFRERKRDAFSAINPQYDFTVEGGRIRPVASGGSRGVTAELAEGGQAIVLSFADLGNPEKDGFGKAVFFADYTQRLDEPPLVLGNETVLAKKWSVGVLLRRDILVEAAGPVR